MSGIFDFQIKAYQEIIKARGEPTSNEWIALALTYWNAAWSVI